MITFPDGTKSGIIGLDTAMEELCLKGVPPDDAAATGLLQELEKYNYFAPSQKHIYKHLFLEEYRRFLGMK
jgi:hypothetical protein